MAIRKEQKFEEVVMYIMNRVSVDVTEEGIQKALCVLFYADRLHLRRYGRLITNEVFKITDHGIYPTITGLDDIIERLVDPYSSSVDLRYISKSDRECLGEAIVACAANGIDSMVKVCHTMCKEYTATGIVRHLPNRDEILEYIGAEQ